MCVPNRQSWIQTHPKGTVIGYPYRKPTSIWRPLSSDSEHPPDLHLRWPVQFLKHYVSRSTDRRVLKSFLLSCLATFQSMCPEHAALPAMHDFVSMSALLCSSGRMRDVVSSKKHPLGSCSWLVIPFSSVWHKVRLQRIVMDICNQLDCVAAGTIRPVKISWSLAGIHFMQMLKSVSRHANPNV